MASVWIAVYLALAGLAIVQAVLVGLQTWEHRRFARSRLRALPGCRASGRAILFVPCRGGDVGLEQNLHSVMTQDYRDYGVHFVLESPGDPAWPIIRRVAAQHPSVPTCVVFAGQADRSGQKVHNLRVATADLDREIEYLAFVDADARPRRGWLRAMLARLDLPGAGAVTGYRWFVPQRATLANLLAYSINSGVAALLGNKGPNLIWGGSWAIRRSTFERLAVNQAWKGTLCDDLVASRVVRRSGLRVEFEPAAMVSSPLDYRFGEMFFFMRRQYFLGRYYARRFFAFGFVMTTLANLVLLGSVAAAVGGFIAGASAAWLPAGVAVLLYMANVFRAAVRQNAGVVYFPHLREALRKGRQFDLWAGPLFGLVNWFGLVAALIGNRVTWRGITYRLSRDGQTHLLDRDDEPTPPRPEEQDSLPACYRKAG